MLLTIAAWALWMDDGLARQGTPLAERASQAGRLDGLHQGAATTFTHSRGWFTFDLPGGWSVAEQTDDRLMVNPGLTPPDTLDALVVVSFGELDPVQTRMDLVALFQAVRPALLGDLRSQGIDVAGDGVAPQRVALAHAAGLVQQWKGRAAGREVAVWAGGLATGGHYLTVTAVVLAGKEDRFLPGVKRMLHSLQPRPPERNLVAERALEGAEFMASDTRTGGTFHTTFAFMPGNRVKKTMIVSRRSGTLGGGASEEWGTFDVVGDEVRLSFRGETDALMLTIEQGRVVALQRDSRTYPRR